MTREKVYFRLGGGGGRVSNGVCLCMQQVGGSGCITPPLVLKCSEIASGAIFGPKQPSSL